MYAQSTPKSSSARARSTQLANVAAVVVILMAGALSTAWVFIVPIFQAPDEPAHFDYAISILGAGRLVRAGDGPPDWIVSPYTRYLMRAVDFDRIMEHSSMRVPKGYGSRAYIRNLDKDAPRLSPMIRSVRTSYIAADYPFGFYALEAGWMGLVAKGTDSLVATFYAARILCVLLMMIGLLFCYLTCLNMGLRPWLAVLLLGAIGFFPLTTFVSSYIQPDNLAFALVSAFFFCATKFRSSEKRLRWVIAIGVVLALLALTKYQFFVSTAVAAVFLVWFDLSRKRPNISLATAVTALAAPSVMALILQRWITSNPAGPVAEIFGPFRAVLMAGPWHTLSYVGIAFAKAFLDFFVTGGTAATYWGVLGWVDTPLVVINERIEIIARIIISSITLVTALLIVLLIVRNCIRILRAVKRLRVSGALRMCASDPVFNSFAMFTAIMFTLYIVTDNFGVEGRHWYPFVLASFLCFVFYAPKVFRQHVRLTGAAATLALAAYAAISPIYATVDIVARYYGEPGAGYAVREFHGAPVGASGLVLAVLRPLELASYHVNTGTPSQRFPVGERLRIQGVAVILGHAGSPDDVTVLLDHSRALPTLSGQFDYVVAEIMRSVSKGFGGFDAVLDTQSLRPGSHVVSAYISPHHDGRFERISPERTFIILPRTSAADGKRPWRIRS